MEQYVYICKKCHMPSHTLYPSHACRYCHGKNSLELVGVFDDQDLTKRLDIEHRLESALRTHDAQG